MVNYIMYLILCHIVFYLQKTNNWLNNRGYSLK